MFPAKINKKEGSELLRTRSLFFLKKMLKHSNSFKTRYKTEAIRLEQIISHQIELAIKFCLPFGPGNSNSNVEGDFYSL